MKRMNFPERRLKRRQEAEARNARTPYERTKACRKAKELAAKLAVALK